jgi:cell wall-associated NlpC family hydrolase
MNPRLKFLKFKIILVLPLMIMRCLFVLFACVSITFLSGCFAGHQLAVQNTLASTDHFSATKPKFLTGIYLDRHHRSRMLSHVVSMKTAEPIASQPVDKKAGETHTIAISNTTTTKEPTEAAHKNDIIAEQEEAATADEHSEELKPLSYEEKDSLSYKYADKINVDPTDITNYALYQFIDQWYGTDYKWGGEDIDGIDCSAFSQKLYSEIYGLDLLRTARQQHRTCKRIRHPADAAEGDLVFFHVKSWRVSHVGVLLKNDYFVHASRTQGVTISNLRDRYWRKRYASCGRVARERESAE